MVSGIKPYPAYLFDLDGTLVDSAPDLNAALNVALARHGFTAVSEDLTRHWVGHGSRMLVTRALENQDADGAALDAVLELFLRHYAEHIADHSRPYPHVKETLIELEARGARLAVVTNKLTQLTEAVLRALGLREHFAAVVCGDTTAQPKPAAEPALHACQALGAAPNDALFVGDSETDVGCARAAGCPVVCVRGGYNHGIAPEELGADAVIESFKDLVYAPGPHSPV